MSKWLDYFQERPLPIQLGVSFVAVGFIGALDYFTGTELSFSIFYLLPIAFIAWFSGWRAGALTALFGGLLWLSVDLLTHPPYSHPLIPYWNALVRFGFFIIVVYTLAALHAARTQREELTHFIVHDLRSPLANIITGLQTLQEISQDTHDATQANLVEMASVAGNRMLTLINSLLDIAQLEGRQMPLKLEQIAVSELVESATAQVRMWAERNHITLTTQLASNISTVYGDVELTRRVLINLLSNAIKFSQANTTITIRVVPAENGMLAFSVSDQGVGISKEWADKVFDKFVQVKARRAGTTVGTGLGLAFCRLAVEAQHGRIWLESEVDVGTTVTFKLPSQAT
ncbi:MAG TPA: HAMP domain-containing sensor histidine kinase [Anaerolineae bacterium]|nr:HAMP domain-containing sensor histidine kinase [Anaerolineae bacterium]